MSSNKKSITKNNNEMPYFDFELNQYTVSYFDPILKKISDDGLRSITHLFVSEAPEYFWIASTSLTGKYHPAHSRGPGGLVRHTFEVAIIAEKLCDCYGIQKTYTEFSLILSAALCHDLVKFGENNDYHKIDSKTAFDIHAELCYARMIRFMYSEKMDTDLRRKWLAVGDLVLTHNGKWGTKLPSTMAQWIVHISDVVSSLKFLVNPDLLKERQILAEMRKVTK